MRPGDAFALLDRPAHGVTVLETNRVMYRDRHDEAGPWLETFEDRLAEAAQRPLEKRQLRSRASRSRPAPPRPAP